MKPRVCLVGPVYPYRGGIAHFTALLAAEFEKDHEVLVASFTRLYPSVFFPGKSQFDTAGTPPVVETLRVIDSANPLSYWRAGRVIARFAPDIVVFQWWHPFFAPAYAAIVCFLKRATHCRIVYLCHNVLPHEASPIDRMLVRIGFGRVDRFLVQSREDERKLSTIKRSARTAVRPHPIYDVFDRGAYTRESARRELGLDGRVILFFGLIRPYKGLGVLLDGFAHALRRLEATLLVVGEFYEKRDPYLKRIDRLGIGERTRIVDRYVADDEVEKYFAAADLVVLPYLSATQSGIVQIAFGFGIPVVVTRVGGLPDVVDDGVTGYVVPPGDPTALGDAIFRFFEENAGPRMRDNVAGARHRFSWRACKEGILDLAR